MQASNRINTKYIVLGGMGLTISALGPSFGLAVDNVLEIQRSGKMVQALSHKNFPPSIPVSCDCGHSTLNGQDL